MNDESAPSPDERFCPSLTRRRFLRLGLALPLFSLGLAFPLTLQAKTTARALTPLPGKKPRAPRLLMIDPGHGGHDPGALGSRGLQEKDVTLDIAQHMAATLEKHPGVQVKLTRDKDEFLPLKERVERGRAAHADLFVSVHADSAPNIGARGLSVYTLSGKASDTLADALAEKENHADVIGGIDLPKADQEIMSILYDLTARRTCNTAMRARSVFVQAIGRKWRLLERPMRAANFAVLRAPDVPSLLIETGFLSNPKDEALLRQPRQRQKIAELMAKELAALLDSSLFE
ncbi:MAG: N-acetylmuramoyl-L-alanine amidase [Alphaproteobacteria bacterium]|nr:N-acetylmuramoyl-L-alanine amidase [Alphaproteobacteria bacterium]